jgi:hypothetical protein
MKTYSVPYYYWTDEGYQHPVRFETVICEDDNPLTALRIAYERIRERERTTDIKNEYDGNEEEYWKAHENDEGGHTEYLTSIWMPNVGGTPYEEDMEKLARSFIDESDEEGYVLSYPIHLETTKIA